MPYAAILPITKADTMSETFIHPSSFVDDGAEHTQKEVADMIGISQSYISRLEKRIIKRLKGDLERIS